MTATVDGKNIYCTLEIRSKRENTTQHALRSAEKVVGSLHFRDDILGSISHCGIMRHVGVQG